MFAEWVAFAAGLVLTVGTGFFVAAEFALVNLDRPELEAQRDRGVRGLGLTIKALTITSTHLSSAQLGITLTTLLTGFLMEPALSALLFQPLSALGWNEAVIRTVAGVSAVVIATVLSMIVGELVPKNFALALPQATAKVVIPFQTLFTTVFKPLIAVLNGLSNAVLRSFGLEPKEELSGARSAEELSSLLRRSASEGALEEDTATLLGKTLAFSELSASDVMTPRLRIESLEPGDSARAVLELARKTGFSRFPVTEDGLDDVVGIVHVKNAISVPRERRNDVPVSALMIEPLRVPDTMSLDALLAELRGKGLQMAIVVDEYGGTAGIATLEDLVEELVGEVADEHDRTRAGVVSSADYLTFPGSLRPDELEERAGITVPEDDNYETVAGFVMSQLGRIPEQGDIVTVPEGEFKVVRMDGRRIDRLRFTPVVVEVGESNE
ncbi:hemolysin family protein [Aurantimicrobium photophilum]|uniref:Magnesium and cobalt efflux protein CorC n=1 Tax=Aurantimicrobium photophilum TaxID=1987356 RepID=A0A2Z3RW46_9MICO|nr:hemolysin family protein [Aurantimicrobium photophilum]AWR21019.1 Magnesium and cobalt efflux protein CorC [Aurantimicrobium photophilum]